MKGYRTYLAAAVIAALGAASQFDWLSFFNQPDMGGLTLLGSAIVMAIFRSITNTPPAVK